MHRSLRDFIIAGTIVIACAHTAHAQRPEPPDLSSLTDEELIIYFRESGLAITDTRAVPVDASRLGRNLTGTSVEHNAARREIVERGSQMTTMLIDELLREAPITRRHTDGRLIISMTTELCDMLWATGDERAVPALLQVVEGMDGTVTEDEQQKALDILERLTHYSVHPTVFTTYFAAPESPLIEGGDYSAIARRYHDFLVRHGLDREAWLRDANIRAHAGLDSDDPQRIYDAIQFLGTPWEPGTYLVHDIDPSATAPKIERAFRQLRWTGETWVYLAQDGEKDIPRDIWNWIDRARHYGPLVRGIVPVIIENHRLAGYHEWSAYDHLRDIGGPEAMKYLFESIRAIEAATGHMDLDGPLLGGSPELAWRSSIRTCTNAIQRWAGRVFASPAEREQWWAENKHRSEEEWLRDGLPIAARQEAERNMGARSILYQSVLAYQRIALTAPSSFDPVSWVENELSHATYLPHRGIFVSRDELDTLND